MFVREKKFKDRNRSYLQIVENEKIDGHVKQNVILSLGCLQTLKESGELRKLADSILKFCEQDAQSSPTLENAQEEKRINWGIPKIMEKLWHLFDFDAIFQKCCKDRAIKANFYRTIELMLSDRFLCPCSKLRSYENQEKYGESEVSLHELYTTLDYLAEFKEQIEKELFEKNVNLFNMQVNVVFYDVTTFHFESEEADELRNFGFSKNNKYEEVQVVLGLLVDQEGRPIGFDLFPGNLYEGHTLKVAIDKLKNRFAIEKLIIVADRGMMSQDNLKALRDSGFEYIISARLKKMPDAIQQQVLDLNSYDDMPISPDAEENEEGKLKYKIYTYPDVFAALLLALITGQPSQNVYREIRKITKHVLDAQLVKSLRDFRKQPFTDEKRQELVKEIESHRSQILILTWSEKRSNRDKAKRDLLVSKAQELLKAPLESLSQRGARRYLKVSSESISLFDEKISDDAKWDGFYGIKTNNRDLHWRTILEHYRNLWRIEESFRILKSHFQTRPMFHWTPRRIQGHLVLCFIAFLFERTIEIELRKKKIPCSPTKIRDAFHSMEASLIDVSGHKFYLAAKLNELAKQILSVLHIKNPAKLMHKEQFQRDFFTAKEQNEEI
jgi:transposase